MYDLGAGKGMAGPHRGDGLSPATFRARIRGVEAVEERATAVPVSAIHCACAWGRGLIVCGEALQGGCSEGRPWHAVRTARQQGRGGLNRACGRLRRQRAAEVGAQASAQRAAAGSSAPSRRRAVPVRCTSPKAGCFGGSCRLLEGKGCESIGCVHTAACYRMRIWAWRVSCVYGTTRCTDTGRRMGKSGSRPLRWYPVYCSVLRGGGNGFGQRPWGRPMVRVWPSLILQCFCMVTAQQRQAASIDPALGPRRRCAGYGATRLRKCSFWFDCLVCAWCSCYFWCLHGVVLNGGERLRAAVEPCASCCMCVSSKQLRVCCLSSPTVQWASQIWFPAPSRALLFTVRTTGGRAGQALSLVRSFGQFREL